MNMTAKGAMSLASEPVRRNISFRNRFHRNGTLDLNAGMLDADVLGEASFMVMEEGSDTSLLDVY